MTMDDILNKECELEELREQLALAVFGREDAEQKRLAAERKYDGAVVECDILKKILNKTMVQLDKVGEKLDVMTREAVSALAKFEKETKAYEVNIQKLLDKLARHASGYGHQVALEGKDVPEEILDLDLESALVSLVRESVVDLAGGDHDKDRDQEGEALDDTSPILGYQTGGPAKAGLSGDCSASGAVEYQRNDDAALKEGSGSSGEKKDVVAEEAHGQGVQED